MEHILTDEDHIDYVKRGVGMGHTVSGAKKTWKKKYFFDEDLFNKDLTVLGAVEFTTKYGYSAENIDYIWNKIKYYSLTPTEDEIHGRNKLLLWLDTLHNDLKLKQIQRDYKIGTKTADNYINSILHGLIKTYKGTGIISFPNERQKQRMVKFNKILQKEMANALFTMDGKHAKCLGICYKERLSHKYHFIPCFNCLFVIERTFGTICAFNLDKSATKHDLTVLRESEWFQDLVTLTNGWIIMADKGYIGHDTANIAACIRTDMKLRKFWSPHFWKQFQIARSDSERAFAHFFVNKFSKLANWKGKGPKSYQKWALNVTCAIIIYNDLKLRNAKL